MYKARGGGIPSIPEWVDFSIRSFNQIDQNTLLKNRPIPELTEYRHPCTRLTEMTQITERMQNDRKWSSKLVET
jgi:hypothetical protein